MQQIDHLVNSLDPLECFEVVEDEQPADNGKYREWRPQLNL
jgi:flavin-binding protein dodecin